jgi:hypothetical protein
MNFYNFVRELIRLNPNKNIYLKDPDWNSDATASIVVDDASKLKLPDGFEYNAKDGITNKGDTFSGEYISIKVQKYDPKLALMSPQKQHNLLLSATFAAEDSVDYEIEEEDNIYSFYNEFSKLNPDLTLNLTDPAFDPCAFDTIYYTPGNEDKNRPVQLPSGFEFVGKTEITNKHNTKTGKYIDIKIKNTQKITDNKIKNKFLSNQEIERQVKSFQKNKDLYRDFVPDVSETTDKFILLDALKKLNPTFNFYFINEAFGIGGDSLFVESATENKNFCLPDGFEYNDKNGITNKHNTKSGLYITLDIKPYNEKDKQLYYTDKQIEKRIQHSKEKEKEY